MTSYIDIDDLRNFQIKENSLQKQDERFKPTPPGFNRENVVDKINGTLFSKLKGYNQSEKN